MRDEPSEWERPELDQAQVEQKIKEYNSQINSNLFMSLNKDGSYTGFIKVQLKLVRPVSVPATKRPPCMHDARKGQRAQAVKRRTSFYLPKDTVKHLHIISHTRASEVIDALLRKFMVVDNPRKFALFERCEKDEQGSRAGRGARTGRPCWGRSCGPTGLMAGYRCQAALHPCAHGIPSSDAFPERALLPSAGRAVREVRCAAAGLGIPGCC
uniref:Ras association domain family member 1 n=1 Tax=Apteryx owenii TaxID=8824 RepID=A0A8B9S8H6_APTOW